MCVHCADSAKHKCEVEGMSRSKIKTANTAQRLGKIPRETERMVASYVDIVCAGQSERNKLAARVGLSVIVQRALRAR